MTLKPWAQVPFELIKHAEEHRIANGDFDKHMALISYDNAIEVLISTYINLDKRQRRGEKYKKEDIEAWLNNYHSKLDFFLDEFIGTSGEIPPFSRDDVTHYHNLRNGMYHEGNDFVPRQRDIDGARTAALYIFSKLFEADGEQLLGKVRK